MLGKDPSYNRIFSREDLIKIRDALGVRRPLTLGQVAWDCVPGAACAIYGLVGLFLASGSLINYALFVMGVVTCMWQLGLLVSGRKDQQTIDEAIKIIVRAQRERCTIEEQTAIRHGFCPDCGSAQLMAGTLWNFSATIQCGNPRCGSKFNVMGPTGIERVSPRPRN